MSERVRERERERESEGERRREKEKKVSRIHTWEYFHIPWNSCLDTQNYSFKRISGKNKNKKSKEKLTKTDRDRETH